jgi:protein arginine kinase
VTRVSSDDYGGIWLRNLGPESDVVMSTRIRLARNVDGRPFPGRISEPDRAALEAELREAVQKAEISEAIVYRNLGSLSALERQMLVERHIISRELANGSGDRGVSFGARDFVSVMTNEEDHLRLQVIRAGFAVRAAFEAAAETDRRLERRLTYAWHDRYGYLTACPTNCGTGLRVSVMMHLPALVLMKQIDKVFQAAAKVGLVVRGFYGEGTNASGDFFQISNQRTLGMTEEQILAVVERITPKIVEYERGVRQELRDSNRTLLEDKVWRALAVLRYARKLSSDEAMERLSAVRLGAVTGLFPDVRVPDVNELFVLTQPAHLQAVRGKELGPPERDVLRASLVRDRLKPEKN